MKDSSSANRQFATEAQPHRWLMVADSLHEQAKALRANWGRSHVRLQDPHGVVLEQWDGANRAVFLLAGFALENAIKAYIVYENPNWISGGRLARKLLSHSLTELAMLPSNLPYKSRGMPVLRAFESGLESWARYPCGRTHEELAGQIVLSDRLWERYLKLASSYGRRMRRMLEVPWTGPFGVYGRYSGSWEFLS